MQLFDDEKYIDDSLSRLFQKGKAELESDAPPSDMWARISKRLDDTPAVLPEPIKKPVVASPSWGNPRKYMLAASLVMGVLTAGMLWQTFNAANNNQLAETSETTISTQPSNPNAAIAQAETSTNIEKEEQAQAEKLKELEKNNQFKPEAMGKVALVPAQEFKPAQTSPAAPEVKTTVVYPTTNGNAGISPNDFPENDIAPKTAEITTKSLPVYAAPPVVIADKDLEKQIAEAAKAGDEVKFDMDMPSNSYRADVPRKAATISNARALSKKQKQSSETSNKLNPRLQILGWLVGNWQETRTDGVSYERWAVKNANTLEAKAFKRLGESTLFEETITIQFDLDLQQTFLYMSLDNNKTTVRYILSGLNPQEFTFTQDEYGTYPEKVILQTNTESYTLSMFQGKNKKFSQEQQTYLQHRNLVSPNKSVRNMRLSYNAE